MSYIIIHGEDVHSQWVTLSFMVKMCIPNEIDYHSGQDVHSLLVTLSFMVRMCIPSELHFHSW